MFDVTNMPENYYLLSVFFKLNTNWTMFECCIKRDGKIFCVYTYVIFTSQPIRADKHPVPIVIWSWHVYVNRTFPAADKSQMLVGVSMFLCSVCTYKEYTVSEQHFGKLCSTTKCFGKQIWIFMYIFFHFLVQNLTVATLFTIYNPCRDLIETLP